MNTAIFLTRLMLSTVALFVAAGCTTNPPQTAAEKSSLKNATQSTLSMMQDKDPNLRSFLDRSYGYAIFPDVSKGGFIAGGCARRTCRRAGAA